MQFENVWIPYGGYWSSPFCAWQGSFATLSPIPFAAELTARALSERGVPLYTQQMLASDLQSLNETFSE